jgi:hypothetical protein
LQKFIIESMTTIERGIQKGLISFDYERKMITYHLFNLSLACYNVCESSSCSSCACWRNELI